MGCTASTNKPEEEKKAGKGEESSEMLDQSEKMKLDEPKGDVEDPPAVLESQSTIFTRPSIGHVVKTIFLGMAFNLFDVYSDVGSGLYHHQPKNVTRLFLATDTVPNYCIALPSTTTGEGHQYYKCLEEDIFWAAITFGCIQLPALVLALCGVVAVVVTCGRYGGCKRMLLVALLLLFIPFPLLVFTQQVASLFIQTDQMELLSAVFLFGEGALEASPQLLLKGKSLGRKLWIMVKLSPAFILSLAFKVGSIAVICALLKAYTVIYLGFGIIITFIVAFNKYDSGDKDEKAGSALFYSLTNTTILAKSFLANREDNFKQMMYVSISWLILHTTTLVGLIIWVGILPDSTHLDHWSSHRFAIIQPDIFYPTIGGILLLGPLSILALWGLKKQVKALEEKEEGERKFWDAAKGNPDPVDINC